MRACSQWNSPAILHELAAYFSLEKRAQKFQNLMFSVFCSNTLIFAPECRKCTLSSPDFKFFFSQVTCIVGARKLDQWGEFFPSLVLQSFCYLLKTLLKTLPDVSTVLHQSWSFHNNRVLLMLWYFRQTACRHLKRTEITGRSTLILFNSMYEGTAWNVSSHLS